MSENVIKYKNLSEIKKFLNSEERPLLNDFENLYFRLETQISTPLDEFSSLFLVKVDVVPLKMYGMK